MNKFFVGHVICVSVGEFACWIVNLFLSKSVSQVVFLLFYYLVYQLVTWSVDLLIALWVNHLFSWSVSLMYSYLVGHVISQLFFQFMGLSVELFSFLVNKSVWYTIGELIIGLFGRSVNQSVKQSGKWSIQRLCRSMERKELELMYKFRSA